MPLPEGAGSESLERTARGSRDRLEAGRSYSSSPTSMSALIERESDWMCWHWIGKGNWLL